jgi:hypothetical protein
MVGREFSEARLALVEADMTDVGYRQDRLIDHLTFMAQDLQCITIVDLTCNRILDDPGESYLHWSRAFILGVSTVFPCALGKDFLLLPDVIAWNI